jgi:hypothetical protein
MSRPLVVRLSVLAAALALTAPALADDDAPRTTSSCVDREIADRLALKRKRRGAVDRLVVKQGRHELTAGGGYYASDLLSGTYLVGRRVHLSHDRSRPRSSSAAR